MSPLPTPAESLAQLPGLPPLAAGAHPNIAHGACMMELVSWVAGEPWSDHPSCVCPVISAFLRDWNDQLPAADRDTLLRPLIPRVIGTIGGKDLVRRRAMMAAHWLIREHTPAWLRLAGLTVHADTLAAWPEIADFKAHPSLHEALMTATKDAASHFRDRSVAWLPVWAAARKAGQAAARDSVWAAGAGPRVWEEGEWPSAWDDAFAAAHTAARIAAWNMAPRDALSVAVDEPAWDAAARGVWNALSPTRVALQRSALRLVERMIEAH